jgi:hypothetical protein
MVGGGSSPKATAYGSVKRPSIYDKDKKAKGENSRIESFFRALSEVNKKKQVTLNACP